MDKSGMSPPHSLNILYFKVLGYWPIQTRNKVFNNVQLMLGRTSLAAFTLFVVSLYVNIICQDDMKTKTSLLPVALVYSLGVMKVHSLVRGHDQMLHLMKEAGSFENSILSKNVGYLKNLVQSNQRRTMTMILSYSMGIISLLTVFAVQPYVENTLMLADEDERTSIFDSWIPWDKTSPLNYSLTYVYELTMLILGSMQQSSYDTMVLALMMHVVMQIRVLKYKLSNLTESEELARTMDNGHSQNVDLRIIEVYKDFQAVTRFIKTMDGLIKGIIFMYFFVASLTMCCTVYQVSLPDNNIVTVVKMVAFTLVMLMQLYMLFWYGNQVTVEVGLLLNAAYNCEWYKQDVRFQNHFLLLRNGFLREHAFSIGNFSKISLNAFLGILKTTYSVYTVMRQTGAGGRPERARTPL